MVTKEIPPSLVREYEHGASIDALSWQYRMTEKTIKRMLTEQGVTLRGRSRPNPIPDDVVARYQAGATISSLVKYAHTSWGKIIQHLKNNGVQLRKDKDE